MSDTIEVLITLPFSDQLIDQIQKISPRLNITVQPARRGKDIPPHIWARTEILFTLNALPEINQAPQLRWVQFYFAGVDHALDLPLLKNPAITFTTLSGAGTPQAAEFAISLMLGLGHHFPEMFACQGKAQWDKEYWDRRSPVELRGSTVGIVGYGSIGREIARLLQPLNVKILATKRDVMHPRDTGYIPKGIGDPEGVLFTRLYPPQALCSMLKECDFVVVTLPLVPDTHHAIGKEELESMKPSAFLVNISRGNVVDPDALLEALQEKKIAGAALDVFPVEPLPENSPFWKLPNIIITPHVGGNSAFYDERAVALFDENLQKYLNGTSLLNRIDPNNLY